MNTAEPPPPPQTSAPIPPGQARTNWLLFWLVLLSPALLTIGSVLLGTKEGDTAPVVAVFGGGISGLFCGAMLGRRFGQTSGMKVLLGIIFALVFTVMCIGMSCFGCLASGYNLKFN